MSRKAGYSLAISVWDTRSWLKTARFYADNLLGEVKGLAEAVTRGAESTLAFDDDDF